MVKENDIVLIYFEEKPLSFARIEEIFPDIKANWYHVRLLVLQIPLKQVTWILKNEYIEGEEFTMDGKKVRLELIVCPADPEKSAIVEEKNETTKKPVNAKIISLSDRKKKG